MNLKVFLSVKFIIETAALCGLLDVCMNRDVHHSLKAVMNRWYLFVISGILQETVYAQIGNEFFPILYVIWNVMAAWLFWRLEIRKEKNFAALWISYSVILFQLCQMFVTCLIFVMPDLAERIADFGIWEEILSTILIWLIGAMTAAVSIRRLPETYSLTFCEMCWAQCFLWSAFAAEFLIFRMFSEEQTGSILTVMIYILMYADIQLYFFSYMQSLAERNQKIEQMQIRQQYDMQMKHAEQISSVYGKLREARHDIRNQMVYIEQMMEQEQYDELKEYFHRQNDSLSDILDMPDTGNRLINAMVLERRETATRYGIPMDIQASVPESLDIEGQHLCSMIGNLLDNAIEASMHVTDPHISLQIQLKGMYLLCCVKNRTNHDVMLDNPDLHTTKPDAQEHGYGIRTIRKISEMYHGKADFRVENGEFIAVVMLLNRKKE